MNQHNSIAAAPALALGAALLFSGAGLAQETFPEDRPVVVPASLVLKSESTLDTTRTTASLAPPAVTTVSEPVQADFAKAEVPVDPLMKLGPGDAVIVQVYGRPEMDTTTYISDDGTIEVPLAGKIDVKDLSPAAAARRIAEALRAGEFLVDPQVSVRLSQFRSQQVSVLGQVGHAGRFPLDSRTSALDLLAMAGGATDSAADVIEVLRPTADGTVERIPLDLNGLRVGGPVPTVALKAGDTLYVPRADQFYITGEVQHPNMYRIEAGMTVMQAIARSGGLTPRGSSSRIEISRKYGEVTDVVDAEPEDRVRANDVIRVKERLF